jgi:hypothetical protein
VTTIYVDRAALLDDSHGVQGFSEGALRSLGVLREAGHRIVIVSDPGGGSAEGDLQGNWRRILPEAVPIRPAEQAWYMTTDADRCQGRSALLRTVLVGAAPAPAAIHRCEAVARDVPAAVLEILAAEAMRS